MADHDWVLRRIDTIVFADGERVERRVTFDLDLGWFRDVAKRCRIPWGHNPLPLPTLAKRPLLEIDVTNLRGESLVIATSDQGAHATTSMLLAILRQGGINVRRIPLSVREQLY